MRWPAALRRLGDERAVARRKSEQAVLEIQGALVLARAFDDPKLFARAIEESERRLMPPVTSVAREAKKSASA